ncbi:MAG: MBL fold metallo-hydrolase [Fibromonadales bacterium]|nr:MBL fold metallo-hydrolase [Fibromonadales bacterium]
MERIYFVEDIVEHQDDDLASIVLFNASLFWDIEKNIQKEESDDSKYFLVEKIAKSKASEIKQGSFITFNSEMQFYKKANGSSVAKHFIFQNNKYRKILIDRTVSQEKKEELLDTEIVSYHVNVGHGNCSFVVGKNTKKIWLIDCSNYDFLQKKNYQKNIDNCILEIMSKYGMSKFYISKIFITHPHYDHYSGVNTLINKGFIDAKSIFYINHWYTFSSGSWNKLLGRIVKLGSKQIEPLSCNSDVGCEIIYPEISVVRTQVTPGSTPKTIVDSNPNNASTVLKIKSRNKSFVFTGDIETAGWSNVKKCCLHFKNCDYYVISHHGSDTGHIKTNCTISNVNCCLSNNVQAILMGRDGAYSGIYSKTVISNFKNINYTECAQNFLEIEWDSNKITRY